MSSATVTREGTFRLGGIVFGWWSVGDEASTWRLVSPDALGAPAADDVILSEDFLAFAAARADDDDVRVLSAWSVFQPEFEWSAEASECLAEHGFPALAREVNDQALVPTPGPIFDRVLIKKSLLETLGSQVELNASTDIAYNLWTTTVGVDHAYFAPAFVDLSTPTSYMRDSAQSQQTGEAHEAYLRAFDAYFYGGLPTRVASTMKSVYLDTLESRLGYSYHREPGKVWRSISTINSIRLRKEFCATAVEQRGSKVFASRLERVAESTSPAAGSAGAEESVG